MDKIFVNFLPPWVETNIQPAFYDKESGSVLQQTARMYAKVQCLVRMFNKLSKETKETVDEYIAKFVELKDFVDTYFENLDVQEEINNKLDAMAEDGTLQSLIYEAINVPQGMSFNLKRIGRKLFEGTLDNETGKAMSMQGGVLIGDNLVAYVLWDSYNALNVNSVIVQNIVTGEIIRTADYNFGWCNSVAYYDGKLYIAVRGTTDDGVSTNNGIIKVLNVGTLALVDTITMPFNVNAIYHNEDGFYLLQESSGNIYLYDNTLTSAIKTIEIDDVNYHQNICVDSAYIYLLTSRAINSLQLFDKETGNLIRAYNVPKFGGRFAVGELQWIDKDGEDIIIGSDCNNLIHGIAQFFKGNLKNNVTTNEFVNFYAQTVYCNSETDNYDADGSSVKPFTEIYETQFIDIPNIVVNGNNKSYKYVYMSDKQYVRIQNATLSEGIYFQYGELVLNSVTVNYSLNPATLACMYLRNSTAYFNTTVFDAGNEDYLINNGGYNSIRFSGCTFSNYGSRIFTGTNVTSEITIDSTDGVSYIPRLNGVPYNLCYKANLNAWQAGDYPWQTDLTESQIDDLLSNVSHIIVGVKTLNGGEVLENTYKIRPQTDVYNINQITSSSSSVNVRIAKTTFKATKEGLTITLNATTQITADGASMPTTTASNSNNIVYVKLVKYES